MTFSDRFRPVNDKMLRRASVLGLLLVFALAILTRCFLGAEVQHPGHGDPAFYYTVAENIADGRGLQIDYIWHYLNHPQSITHESHDYWLPLTSIILALPLAVFGKSLLSALVATIFAGLLLGVVTYLAAKTIAQSNAVAFLSASVVLFFPALFTYSLQPDSTIFYALFASSSLYFLIKGLDRPAWFLPAGVLVGLSQLTRQDGALLVIVFLVIVLFSRCSKKEKAVYGLAGLGLYLLVLSPLIVANFKIFGVPFPPGPSRTVFLTEYEDLYSYSKELSFRTYLDWGIANIILSKLRMVGTNLYTFYKLLGDFLAIFLVVGILRSFADRKPTSRLRDYLPSLSFLILLFGAYSLLYTFSKAFERSSLAVMPFVIVFVVDSVRRMLPSRVGSAAIGMLLGILAVQSVQAARLQIRLDAEMGRRLAGVGAVIEEDVVLRGDDDVVVMTRDPWELHYSTQYKAVQIPNDDLDTILEVAHKFDADYVLLPAPRAALEELYHDRATVKGLTFVGSVPDSEFKVYRIGLQ